MVLLVVAELLTSFGTTLVVINTMSLRHELTPDNLQGRVTAFLQLTIWVGAPVGIALSTALAGRIGAMPILVAMGGIVLLLVGMGAFTPVRVPHPEVN